MKSITHFFTCLLFLRIKNPSLRIFQFWVPIILTIGAILLLNHIPNKSVLFNTGGLVDEINNLLNIMIGFYITSLAVVATFDNDNVDSEIKGIHKTTLKGKTISRRSFLCYLFGYCAFISIVIYILGLLPALFGVNEINIHSLKPYLECFKFGWAIIYFFSLASLLSATLLGLHYLTDRIHR